MKTPNSRLLATAVAASTLALAGAAQAAARFYEDEGFRGRSVVVDVKALTLILSSGRVRGSRAASPPRHPAAARSRTRPRRPLRMHRQAGSGCTSGP